MRNTVQAVVEAFHRSKDQLMVLSAGTYANLNSARGSYKVAIKTLGYNMMIRTIKGSLYLIKVQTPNRVEDESSLTKEYSILGKSALSMNDARLLYPQLLMEA